MPGTGKAAEGCRGEGSARPACLRAACELRMAPTSTGGGRGRCFRVRGASSVSMRRHGRGGRGGSAYAGAACGFGRPKEVERGEGEWDGWRGT